MGRKGGTDGPWMVFPATDQALLSTTATVTLSPSSTTSSTISQTNVSTAVTLAGASGVDSLTGSSITTSRVQGNTTLVSTSSNSTLIGSSGNDTLIGSQGSTTLIGNGGADLFVVQIKTGIDQVMDFTDGQDKLMLANSLTFGQLSLTQQGQDTLISANNTPLMLLHNISSNLITAADIA
jgi:Ca2+-binding RTX toxin-like protein